MVILFLALYQKRLFSLQLRNTIFFFFARLERGFCISSHFFLHCLFYLHHRESNSNSIIVWRVLCERIWWRYHFQIWNTMRNSHTILNLFRRNQFFKICNHIHSTYIYYYRSINCNQSIAIELNIMSKIYDNWYSIVFVCIF